MPDRFFEVFDETSAGTTFSWTATSTSGDRSFRTYNPSTINMGFITDTFGRWRINDSKSTNRGAVHTGYNATGMYRVDYEVTMSLASGTASTYRMAIFTEASATSVSPNTSYIKGTYRTLNFADTAVRKTVSGGGFVRLRQPSRSLRIKLFSEATVASTAVIWEYRLSGFRVSASTRVPSTYSYGVV